MSNEQSEPVVIRLATKDDLVDLIVLGQEYYKDTLWEKRAPEAPDWGLFAWSMDNAIQTGALLVAEDKGKLVGFMAVFMSYWLFPSGDMGIDIWYVKPEYRGSGATRGFRAALQKLKQKMKPAICMEGSTSGCGSRNEKMYTNMLKKEGYTALGPVMIQFRDDYMEITQ